MRKYLLAAPLAGAAGATAAPAFAQDAAPFSGVRVEGVAGYDTTDIEGDNTSGVAYGVGVGYDFQAGGVVLGVEGEVSDSTLDECVNGVNVPGDELCAS